jgi:hypothetical protein
VARSGTPLGFAFLSVALLLMSGCRTDVASQEGTPTRVAAEAKRQGRSSTTVTAILDENGTGSSLPEIIKSSSVSVRLRSWCLRAWVLARGGGCK